MISRKSPPRKQSLKRASEQPRAFSTIVRKRNPKRRAANHQRAYGEYAEYIRSLPCLVCGIVGYTEAAHSATGGTSRKADARTLVPLCGEHPVASYSAGVRFVEGCHRESHWGIKTFERRHGIDLKRRAADLWAAWQGHVVEGGDDQ